MLASTKISATLCNTARAPCRSPKPSNSHPTRDLTARASSRLCQDKEGHVQHADVGVLKVSALASFFAATTLSTSLAVPSAVQASVMVPSHSVEVNFAHDAAQPLATVAEAPATSDLPVNPVVAGAAAVGAAGLAFVIRSKSNDEEDDGAAAKPAAAPRKTGTKSIAAKTKAGTVGKPKAKGTKAETKAGTKSLFGLDFGGGADKKPPAQPFQNPFVDEPNTIGVIGILGVSLAVAAFLVTSTSQSVAPDRANTYSADTREEQLELVQRLAEQSARK